MNIRDLGFDILKKIEKEDVYVQNTLSDVLRRMQFADKRDRAFLTRLVEGVTERKLSLDYIIDKFSKNNKKTGNKTNNKTLKMDVRIILRMAIYQIRFMESVPDRAAISEAVSMTKARGYAGLAGFVNGLLRNVARAKEENRLDSFLMSRLEYRYSTPQWLCDFLVKNYGKEKAKLILEDQFKEHDTVIRVNTLKTDVGSLKEAFSEKGIITEPGIISDRCLRIRGYDIVKRLPGYNEGLFVVQDETSAYTVSRIGIKPGDKVLDLCAAPGGKSLLAYELAADDSERGIIVSRDVSDPKLDKILENAERLGIPVRYIEDEKYEKGINLELSDATKLDSRIASLPEEMLFDVVIADVPCSGLGIIGRKNDIKYHMTPDILEKLSQQGLVILENAVHYVKKDGRICYSTCTINPKENEEVVNRFLGSNSDFEKIEEKTFLQGIDGSDGFYFCILRRIN